MLLFLLSAAMFFVSSYLLASCFEIKKYATGIIYTLLIAFAQVVLNIELLSLFKAISVPGVLTLNILFLAGIVYFWNKAKRPLYKPQVKEFLSKTLKSAKKDHTMFLLIFAFVFFIIVTIYVCAIAPVISFDAQVYHINRCVFWIFQKSLNHFDIADVRNLVMPINSEILYTWDILFFKKDMGIGFFSFFAYLLSITSLYGFLEFLGYSNRKRLWAVFMLSSIASVVIQASGTETDILVGGLVLTGVFLFALAAKKNSTAALYFSALSFALAIGTKTSAFFMIPACLLLFLFFTNKYHKGNVFKYTKIFLGFSILNFIIFSSYNYVLNLIHYHNPMGSIYLLSGHASIHNLKAYFSSFVRHMFLMFDFTGFIYSDFLQGSLIGFQNKILHFFHIAPDYNVIIDNKTILNRTLIDPFVGCGIIGIIVFLPATVISIAKILIKKTSYKVQTMALLGFSFYLSILTMSMIIGFMVFNTRFLASFIILTSPIFVLTYIKNNTNILKYIILFYSISYLIFVSTNIWARDFIEIINLQKSNFNISQIREKILCSTNAGFSGKMPYCILRDKIKTFPKNTSFGIISSENDRLFIIKLLEYDSYKINTLVEEKLQDYDLSKYDFIIVTRDYPYMTSMEKYDELKNTYKIVNKKVIVDEKNNPNFCFYQDDNNILNTGTTMPRSCTCLMPTSFLMTKGFKMIGYIKTKSRLEQDLQQFYFFKNIRNQP